MNQRESRFSKLALNGPGPPVPAQTLRRRGLHKSPDALADFARDDQRQSQSTIRTVLAGCALLRESMRVP